MFQPGTSNQQQYENNYEPLLGPSQNEKLQETIHALT
jgi:hypothetical protein